MSFICSAIIDHKDLVHQKSMSVCMQLSLWIYSAHVVMGLAVSRSLERFGDKKEAVVI